MREMKRWQTDPKEDGQREDCQGKGSRAYFLLPSMQKKLPLADLLSGKYILERKPKQ